MASVAIKLERAEGLKAVDRSGTSDPYVVINAGHVVLEKCPIVKKSLNPVWNFTFPTRVSFDHKNPSATSLEVKCFDKNVIEKDVPLGECEYTIPRGMKTNQKVNVALDLHAGPKQEKGITGKLFLELTYHGIPEPPPRTPSSEVSAKFIADLKKDPDAFFRRGFGEVTAYSANDQDVRDIIAELRMYPEQILSKELDISWLLGTSWSLPKLTGAGLQEVFDYHKSDDVKNKISRLVVGAEDSKEHSADLKSVIRQNENKYMPKFEKIFVI